MKMVLLSKNKFQFVNASVSIPPKTDSSFPAWERCNTLVLSWLLHSVSTSIAKSVLWFDNAIDVWNDLKDRFSQGDAFRISELQEEIYSFQQGTLPVTDYFTNLKILWDDLMNLRPLANCSCNPRCSCGVLEIARKYQENDYVIRFLKVLNENFAGVRSQIMLIEPLPPINKVFAMVIQQERQINSVSQTSSQKIESNAFANKAVVNSSGGSLSTRKFASNTRRLLCTFCGNMGHVVDKCYKKHGYPPGFKARTRTGVANQVETGMVNVQLTDDSRNEKENEKVNSSSVFDTSTTMPFTRDQYMKLLGLLQSTEMSSSPIAHANAANKVVCSSYQPSGHQDLEDDWVS